jgi:hypothetical protein
MVRPEKTDQFRTVEDVVARATQASEKDLDEQEKAEASTPDSSDTTAESGPSDPRH